jgi:hypothetical protein
MKNIKNFNEFLNENNSENVVNASNVIELKDKLLAVVATEDNEELKKGFEFTIKNIDDYDDSFIKEMCDIFFNNINAIIKRKFPKFWSFSDKGYSGNMFIGSNYEKTKNMDIKEIAKLIREELDIYFSDWKFSVKISRYSGGQSLTVYIKDMPYTPFSEEVDLAYKNNTQSRNDLYNQKYLKDYKKIQSIVDQYNMDDSDVQTDYFHSRFYGFVNLDDSVKAKFYPENSEVKRHEQFDKEWKEMTARKKAKADELKKQFKYKKGDKVIFIYDKESSFIPKGEYEAVILKAPNGRGQFPKYDIRFKVDKTKRNGEVKNLDNPIYYTTSLYSDDKLKDFNG